MKPRALDLSGGLEIPSPQDPMFSPPWPRLSNDSGSSPTKVQKNVFDLQKGFGTKISDGALDAMQRRYQERVYIIFFSK